MRRLCLVFLSVCLGSSLGILASTLTTELQVSLTSNMAWAADLAVDSSGNMYVLGRNSGAGPEFQIYKYSSTGNFLSTFGGSDLGLPNRLAVTASGRTVVGDGCHGASCETGLVVFSSSGQLERFVSLSTAGMPIQLLALNGESVAFVSEIKAIQHEVDFNRVDVSSGQVLVSTADFFSMATVDKFYMQRALDEENCMRDVFLARAGTGNNLLAVGYSALNAVRTVDYNAAAVSSFSLAAMTPPALSQTAQNTENDATTISQTAGELYSKDTSCGYYQGLAADAAGNIVVTGRGLNGSGQAISEVYSTNGQQLTSVVSPYPLNRTLRYAGGKAYCICNTGLNSWSLFRYAIS